MDGLMLLALILLLGTLGSFIALKLKVSNVFFLILIGMLLRVLNISNFPKEGIVIITIVGLVMIVFTNSIKFRIKDLLRYSSYVLKLEVIYFILTLVLLSLIAYFLFDFKSVILVFLLASLVYGIDPSITLVMLVGKKRKICEILKIEAILNTPITIIISLTFLNLLLNMGRLDYTSISNSLLPFLKQFVYAFVVGIVFGFLVVLILRKSNLGNLNYMVVITSAIVTYVLAEYIRGSGVLAVTIFGLIFGNYHLKKTLTYEKFFFIFSDALEIVIFILIGMVILIPADDVFIIKGAFLFLAYLLVRFLSIQLSLKKFRLKEKIFMSLNVAKGIDVAVIILIIISGAYLNIGGIETVLNICLLFIWYSVVLSTIATRFESYFLSYNKNPGDSKNF